MISIKQILGGIGEGERKQGVGRERKEREEREGENRAGRKKEQNGLIETPWSSLEAGTFIKAFVYLHNGPMQFFPTRRTSIQINYHFRF